VARSDPESLRDAVKQARPFLAFRLERVMTAGDMRSPEGRARTAERAMEVIAEHPNELVRDQYLREVADRCRIDADRLRARAVLAPRRVVADSANGSGGRDRPRADSPEIEALRLAVRYPAVMAERLGLLQCDRAEEVLFADEIHLAAFRALAEADTLHQAIEDAGPAAALLLQQLAVEDTDADADEVICRLVSMAAKAAMVEIEAEVRSSPELALQRADVVGWLKLITEELDERKTRIDAAGRLVPWLLSRGEEMSNHE
jgi:DNA primase